MKARISNDCWWPGQAEDLQRIREQCKTCNETAPSQPRLPPVKPRSPDYPMQQISADYFAIEGHNYLVIVDRYSGWPVVAKAARGNASELCSLFRHFFLTYGCSEECTTDGGRQFESTEFENFMKRWNCSHHITSTYNPHSNLLAELGVISMKRLIHENTTHG